MWIPGLFSTTFYFPNKVVRQFRLLQDASEGDSLGLLRESTLCPFNIIAFMITWHERVVALFQRIPSSVVPTTEDIREIQALIDD